MEPAKLPIGHCRMCLSREVRSGGFDAGVTRLYRRGKERAVALGDRWRGW